MTATVVRAGTVLAKTGEAAKSGPLGLALILVLCVACYFLFKSMSKHLKKVREEFPSSASGAEPGAVEPGGAGAVEPGGARAAEPGGARAAESAGPEVGAGAAENAAAPAPADEKAPPPAS